MARRSKSLLQRSMILPAGAGAALALLLAAAAPAPATAGAPADPKIDRLWRAKCAGCHGEDGKGQTEQGKKMGIGDLSSAAWQKDRTDDKIKETILNGIKEEKGGKKKEM